MTSPDTDWDALRAAAVAAAGAAYAPYSGLHVGASPPAHGNRPTVSIQGEAFDRSLDGVDAN